METCEVTGAEHAFVFYSESYCYCGARNPSEAVAKSSGPPLAPIDIVVSPEERTQ